MSSKNHPFPPLVFIEVSRGAISEVSDQQGNQYVNACVIDYDMEQEGQCPVCWDPRYPDEVCAKCGYDPKANKGDGNAIECAARLWRERHP